MITPEKQLIELRKAVTHIVRAQRALERVPRDLDDCGDVGRVLLSLDAVLQRLDDLVRKLELDGEV